MALQNTLDRPKPDPVSPALESGMLTGRRARRARGRGRTLRQQKPQNLHPVIGLHVRVVSQDEEKCVPFFTFFSNDFFLTFFSFFVSLFLLFILTLGADLPRGGEEEGRAAVGVGLFLVEAVREQQADGLRGTGGARVVQHRLLQHARPAAPVIIPLVCESG